MPKSGRLLELMRTVQTRKAFTVRELAEEFGVSYRTMLRYLQEISELGVPLYSEVGVNGGYRVLLERNVPPIHWGEVSTKTLENMGLRGRTQKTPEIVRRAELRVIGIPFTGTYQQLVEEMPKIWTRFLNRYSELPGLANRDVWLDVAQENSVTNTFTQYVCAEVHDFRAIPHGMVAFTIPAQKYAVFTHTGAMAHVENTYYSAFRWLEAHSYERIPHGLRFELYDHRYIPPFHDRSREGV